MADVSRFVHAANQLQRVLQRKLPVIKAKRYLDELYDRASEVGYEVPVLFEWRVLGEQEWTRTIPPLEDQDHADERITLVLPEIGIWQQSTHTVSGSTFGGESSPLLAALSEFRVDIRQCLNDWIAYAQEPTTKRKSSTKSTKQRGRPKPTAKTVQKEAKIAAAWKQARDKKTYKGDFARDNNMTVKDLDRLLNRHELRNRSPNKCSE